MLPALILLAGTAAVYLGFRLLARNHVKTEGVFTSLPLFYAASLPASAAASAGYLTGFAAVILAAALITPLYARAEQNTAPSKASTIIKASAQILFFAAVFKHLTDQGLNISLLLTYGAVAAAYTAVARKMGGVAGYAVAAPAAAAGLYAYLTNALTLPADVTVIGAVLLLYLFGCMGGGFLDKAGEASAPVAAAFIVMSAVAVAYSAAAPPPTVLQKPFALESIPSLTAAALVISATASPRQGSRFFEALLLVLALAVAVSGPVFHTAFANLSTPLLGEPVREEVGAVFNAAMQLVGMSLLAKILHNLLEGLKGFGGVRTRPVITYGVPAMAVALAAASTGTAASQTLYAAAAANLLIPTAALANAGWPGLAAAAILLFISYNVGVEYVVQAVSSPQFSTATAVPVMLSTAVGVWAYSEAVLSRLGRRAIQAGGG